MIFVISTISYKSFDIHIDDMECYPNPCKNGAACEATKNSHVCHCAPGWKGTMCTESEDTQKCFVAELKYSSHSHSNA